MFASAVKGGPIGHLAWPALVWAACLALGPVSALAQLKVRVEPVIRAPILEQLPLSGSVLSPRSSNLATQESGLVEAIKVEEGDAVEAGDVLLELDAELAELELQRLQAMREEAQLMFSEAQRLADEARRLIDARNISQTEYSARLANEAAGQSRVQQLEVQIEAQRLRLRRHRLMAPFSGIIAARLSEVGEWLDSGTAAFQLVQTDPLRVTARVPERYFGEVKAGTPVLVRVDARPGEDIKATVDAVVAATDANTRSFTVRMDIPNPGARLAPGMSAHLQFSLGGEVGDSVLQVAADAIVRRGDGSAAVWVVRNGVASAIPVTVGRRNGPRVEVISDELRENDQAVTLGNESLRPGESVIVDGPAGRG